MANEKITISSSKLIELKERIKAEMARRSYQYGSLFEFANTNYDFDKTPTVGADVGYDYGEKTINLALKINDIDGLANIDEPYDFMNADFINLISDKLDVWETEELEQATTGCRGQCTGLCAGSCGGNCSSCSNTCSGTCYSSCTGNCMTTCTGCDSGCYGGCKASCYDSCSSLCSSGCSEACAGECVGGCYGECSSWCTGSCSGTCGSGCSGGCNSCTGGCTNTC